MKIRSLKDVVFGSLKEASNDDAISGDKFDAFFTKLIETMKPLAGSEIHDVEIFNSMFFQMLENSSLASEVHFEYTVLDQKITRRIAHNQTSIRKRELPESLFKSLYRVFKTLKTDENRSIWFATANRTLKLWEAGLSSDVNALKSVKPEVPEKQIDDAGMGSYAFAPRRRKQVPVEQNTDKENDLWDSLDHHVETNRPMEDSKTGAYGFKNILKHGWYDSVINEPKVTYVFRGMALSRDELLGLGVTMKQLIAKSSDKTSVKATYRPLVTGQSSSWSDSLFSAKKFAQPRGTDKPYIVVAVAKVADNHNSFMSGKNGFYNISGLDEYAFENEVIGLGNIKVFEIHWQYFDFKDFQRINDEFTEKLDEE